MIKKICRKGSPKLPNQTWLKLSSFPGLTRRGRPSRRRRRSASLRPTRSARTEWRKAVSRFQWWVNFIFKNCSNNGLCRLFFIFVRFAFQWQKIVSLKFWKHVDGGVGIGTQGRSIKVIFVWGFPQDLEKFSKTKKLKCLKPQTLRVSDLRREVLAETSL